MKVRGRLLGDSRIRLERVSPQEYRAPDPPKKRGRMPAPIILVAGFLALIAIGTFLLTLPASSESGQFTPILDALFTATSAVSVTGLVVVDTGTYWSGFGQLVILVLIQIGGFGFMTSSTLLLLLVVRRRTRLRDRVLVQETIGGGELGDVTALVTRIAIFSLIAEIVGAVIVTLAYLGDHAEGPNAIWFGVFHSISGFNNSGFDLFGAVGQTSLRGLQTDFVMLGTLGTLIFLGGLGYAIVEDVVRQRRWARMALETKVVLTATVGLMLAGATAVAAIEWDNPATLGSLSTGQKVYVSAFEALTLRTAGFSALDTAALLEPTLFIVMALMFIGGASGSTAGGIKVNTFSILMIAIVSTARGQPSAEAFGRRIEHAVVYRALAVALLSIAFLFLIALALELLANESFVDILFEAISAYSTTGASRGITAGLSDAAQVVLIIAMFVGRLGPLALVIGLTARRRTVSYRHAVESIRIG